MEIDKSNQEKMAKDALIAKLTEEVER
jgi:hypothetical protein